MSVPHVNMAQLYFPLTVPRKQAGNKLIITPDPAAIVISYWLSVGRTAQHSPATPLTAGFIQQSHCPHSHLTVELTGCSLAPLCNARLPGTSVTPASSSSPLSHHVLPDGQTKGITLDSLCYHKVSPNSHLKDALDNHPRCFPHRNRPQILKPR